MKKQIFILYLILIGCGKNDSKNQKGYQTENVILITLDGVRWEDCFMAPMKILYLIPCS